MIWFLWIHGILFGLAVLWIGYAWLMGFLAEREYQALQDTHDLPKRVDAAALELVGKRPYARLTIAV